MQSKIIMIEKLIKQLNKHNLDGYKIIQVDRESFQLFFVHDKVETIRNANSTDININVYVKHDGLLGDASFVVYPSHSEDEIDNLINDAKQKALSLGNKPYELIKNQKASFKNDPFIEGKSLREVAEEIVDAIFQVKGNDGATLNATEIFVNKITNRVVNSEGTDKSSVSYTGMIETIPTFNFKDESVEIYAQKNFNTFDKDNIKEYIKSQLFEVEARAKAKKIELDKNIKVTLRSEELATVLSQYVYQLNYQSLYTHSNVLNKGDKIQDSDDADKLTITLSGNVKGCSYSANYDSDGSNLVDRVIIKDGEVVNFFGGSRFAQYVNEENTGNLQIMQLNCGNLTKDDLKNECYLECLQFSGIQSDLLNDYVGGEVRLAILHKDGKDIPVTGFSISGKLSEVLNSIKLSKEITKDPRYSGPKFAMLDKFSVL